MRFSRMLLLGVASLAVAAAAQEAEPSAEPDREAKPTRGLSDLEAMVNQLLEEETEPVSTRSLVPPEPAEAGADAGPAADARPTEAETAEQPSEETAEPAAEAAPVEEDAPPAEAGAAPIEATPAEEEPAEALPAREAETSPAEPAAPPAPPPLTRAEIAQLERTSERGQLLIAIARAGILATQDMLTRLSDPEGAGVAGWIAEPAGNGMEVTFYSNGEGGLHAVYRATVLGGRISGRSIHLGADRPPLNPLQARMAAAREATEGLDNPACSEQPFNVLVVPPAGANAPIDVYQTTAPTASGHFPLGGHYRATIGADGTVADRRAFTNSCVELDVSPAQAGAPQRPVGITHFLDPMPTEIHLFLSQLIGRPLLVATGDPQRIWLVTPERIAEVRN